MSLNFDYLLNKIDSIFNLVDGTVYPFETALLLLSRTYANMLEGNYAGAFQDAINASGRFEQIKENHFQIKSLIALGNICPYIRNYNMAEDYYNKALEMITSHNKDYYQLLLNKSNVPYWKGETEKSIELLEEVIPKLEAYQDIGLIAMSYVNMGAYYSSSGRNEKAYVYYQKILDIIDEIDNFKLMNGFYQNMGYYYLSDKEYDKAYHYYSIARGLVDVSQNLRQSRDLIYGLALFFDQTNNCDSSLYYLKQYVQLNNHLINNPKTVEVYQSYVTMLIESSEQQLKITEQDLLLKNKQVTVTTISAISIIGCIAFLLIIIMQKNRNARQREMLKEAENKELSERLSKENEIQKLQTGKMEAQIREITSSSLLLSNKNHLMQQILEFAKQSLSNKNKNEAYIQKIIKVVNNNMHTDNDWNNFMLHFDKVHPRFFEKLQSNYSDLTPNDIKLCAYIRIGMSLKQIAQMLNITPDSVKTNRYRLRKRLNLKESDNLDDFIHAI